MPGMYIILAEAAELGSKLIVALNTDDSVKRQGKGENRPVNNEDARSSVLAGLGYVDMIVFFDDETPSSLIETFTTGYIGKGCRL